MKIHIPKHINFAPDSYMYKTFFFLPILYNCFVPSGKALGFSEQRDGKKKCRLGTSGRTGNGDWPQ